MTDTRNPCTQPVVLLTGATTGIGLALAQALVACDYRVVLTAREASLPRFDEVGLTASDRVRIEALDVTDAGQADAVVADITQTWGGVDILINNAGVCYRAVMEHLTDDDERDQFAVNYLGPLHLIRAVLPGMRAKRSGTIVNLSSVGGMMAMPTMGGYSASKFALEGASEALWYELRPWGIRVILVEPGFVHSNSFRNAAFTPASRQAFENRDAAYHAYYKHLIAFIEKMMCASRTSPEDIARKILRAVQRKHPPLRLPVTLDARMFAWLRRLLPSRLYHWTLYRGLPHISEWVPPASTDSADTVEDPC